MNYRKEADPVSHVSILPFSTRSTVKPSDCKAFVLEVLKYRGDEDIHRQIEEWEVPKFPVNGHDLVSQGCPKGKMMSVIMKKLREMWKQSDFEMGHDELVASIPKVLDETDPSELTAAPKLTRKEKKMQAGLKKK